jgi:hypothetical protein
VKTQNQRGLSVTKLARSFEVTAGA